MSEKLVFTVKMNRNYLDDDVSDLQSNIDNWLLEPFTLIVLDFSETMRMEQKAKQMFLQFAQTLKKNDKQTDTKVHYLMGKTFNTHIH